MDHLHVTPARVRQAEVEQPVLQHLARHGDRFALEQGEIRDAEYARLMVLQEHHLPRWAVLGLPLLDTALDGAFAPIPLLAWEGLLQMQQQRLGFQLRRFLEHRHQHAVPDLRQRIGAGAPVPAPPLLLPLGLELTPIDPLGAAHRDPDRISSDLLAEATGPVGHVPLLDP
jgi:hypothetical protein